MKVIYLGIWVDAISMECYVLNRILICPILDKTLYELLKGRKPNLSYLHVFRCKCFILNNGKDNLGMFDAKADEGIFLGYSQSRKAYRVYHKRLLIVEELVHINFDESYPKKIGKGILFLDVGVSLQDILKEPEKGTNQPKAVEHEKEEDNDCEEEKVETSKYHLIDNILGDITKGVTTRSR